MRCAGCGNVSAKSAQWSEAVAGGAARLSYVYAGALTLDLLEKDDCLNGEQSPCFHRPLWRSGQRCGAIRQRRVSKVLGAYRRLTFLV
jgi:hypothetical protein